MAWKKSDIILFAIAVSVIVSCFSYIGYQNYKINRIRPQAYQEAVDCLCNNFETIEFQDGSPPKVGEIARISVPEDCEPLEIPTDLNPCMVLFDPESNALRVGEATKENVFGLVGSYGPDGDCDYDESSVSIIEYSPTNGLRSNGDVICLKD
ncbi:MAG: hypothetical protein KC944_16770 [Candidatus Omnitrophica bacterium]|nr:hypothetical protein [Candidatus Omnitrophota bacterium]